MRGLVAQVSKRTQQAMLVFAKQAHRICLIWRQNPSARFTGRESRGKPAQSFFDCSPHKQQGCHLVVVIRELRSFAEPCYDSIRCSDWGNRIVREEELQAPALRAKRLYVGDRTESGGSPACLDNYGYVVVTEAS